MDKTQKEILQNSLDREKKVLKDLRGIYNKALDDIDDKLARLMKREEDAEGSELQSIIYQKQYQEALKKQINGIIDNMDAEQFTTISDYLSKSYEEGFFGAMYEIHSQGIPLVIPIDQDQVVRALQTESNISEGLYKKLGEDTTLLKRRISNNIARGIAQGSSYTEIAKNIAGGMVGYNPKKPGGTMSRAMRIARTEGHRIQETASNDAKSKAISKGADILKQWDATLDGRTRDSHRQVDGEIREFDEPFSNGLMFPGDPDGSASEVINCRCVSRGRARWMLDEDELNRLKERADFYELDKSENFDDFKKKYLNAVENSSVEEKINTEFKPAKTIQDADKYLEKYGITTEYEKGKINLEVANMINKTVEQFKEVFGDKVKVERIRKYPKRGAEFVGAYFPAYSEVLLNKVSAKDSMKRLGQDAKLEKDYGAWSTGETEHFIRHELGHAVHSGVGKKNVQEKLQQIFDNGKKGIRFGGENGYTIGSYAKNGLSVDEYVKDMKVAGDTLSGYGFSSVDEMVAESVAEYMSGNPREFAKSVVRVLLEA